MMKENKIRPAGIVSERSDISSRDNKDIPKVTNRQRNVLNLLRNGKHSAADITIALGYCHPASYIRTLRDKGFNIVDEWVETKDTRYKQYWL